MKQAMIQRVLSPFGLEITATQPTQFTTLIAAESLKALARQHRIVLLRGFQTITKEALVAYAKQMGPLLEWEFGNVMEMKAEEAPKNYLFTHGHVPFHWDGAFHQEPRFLLFHCMEAPDQQAGGETCYTDTQLIWRDASDEEKKQWTQYHLTYQTEKVVHYGGKITVPLVQKHIDTQETILRFAEPVPDTMKNPVSVSVDRLDQAASEAFIKDMAARCYDKKYCYTHTWQQNDFLIADNFSLLHARNAFKQFSPRHLRRVQVL